MPKEIIVPEGTAKPLAPFVPATKADNIVYVSGTLAFDEHNNVVHVGDAAAQTRHILETIKRVLATAGGTMDDVTFNHIFVKDWPIMARLMLYMPSIFQNDKPARYCVQTGLVKPEALVEIASVAHVA